ncbi:MAG: NAD(P)H-dependent oxidoreductase [Gammaproteobacteria bacterium]|nr:NAD(P)H-dependent oxidoreductase [Gammaproteobacteria bacterium]
MMKRIVIIQGHPDPAGEHFCHALAESYAAGAREAGHAVSTITVAEIDFPLLHSKEEWEHGELPKRLLPAQNAIRDADHLVFVYPLWMGTMPAALKGFLEQVLRTDLTVKIDEKGHWQKLMKGTSARVVVTMGMPALAYRWFFRAHSLKSLERNVLKFIGIKPVRETLVGMVENLSPEKRERWCEDLKALGRKGI